MFLKTVWRTTEAKRTRRMTIPEGKSTCKVSWGCWQFSSPGRVGHLPRPSLRTGLTVCREKRNRGACPSSAAWCEDMDPGESQMHGWLPQDSYCTGGGQETGGWASKEKWNHPKPQSSWEMVTLVGGACNHTQQGSPSELWQILNLQDVEAKFLWQRWQRQSRISIQSPGELRPDRGLTKNRTSLSLTFLRRQSPLEEGAWDKHAPGLTPRHLEPERTESNCNPGTTQSTFSRHRGDEPLTLPAPLGKGQSLPRGK